MEDDNWAGEGFTRLNEESAHDDWPATFPTDDED
jgi:hypothetical protein